MRGNLFGGICLHGICLAAPIKAGYSNKFDGSVGYFTGDVSGYVTKYTSTSTKGGINWNYTDEGDYRQWFIVANSNNANRGEVLLQKCDGMNHSIPTSTTHSYYYKLRSHRENIVDPNTNVRGTWQI